MINFKDMFSYPPLCILIISIIILIFLGYTEQNRIDEEKIKCSENGGIFKQLEKQIMCFKPGSIIEIN